jgi:hypothetical protein
MGLFNFLKLKETHQLTDTERAIIKKVHYEINNPNFFKNLYFSFDSNFKKSGYKSFEEGLNEHAREVVINFLTNAHNFNYLISNADVMYSKFKDTASRDVTNALEQLASINYRVKRGEYILRNEGNMHYPSILCMETPEQTSLYYLEMIEPLLKL